MTNRRGAWPRKAPAARAAKHFTTIFCPPRGRGNGLSPHYVLDYESKFRDAVIDEFAGRLSGGRGYARALHFAAMSG